MGREIVNELSEKVVKTFLDTLILAELRNNVMSGYDFIQFINRKFRVLLSSGTVYQTLYSLERRELIKGMFNERKRFYMLTEKGKERIEAILRESQKIQLLVMSLLK